jgi:hypothetical protein
MGSITLKQQLYTEECRKGSELLSGSLSIKPKYKNVLSSKVNGLRVQCKIESKATIAVLKNIKVNIKLISSTGAVVATKSFVIYDLIGPNAAIDYTGLIDITHQEYVDYKEFKSEIVDAECI